MFGRILGMPVARRAAVTILATVGSAALIAVLSVTFLNATARVAHGSGSGGGGCYAVSGPVCTFQGMNANADFQTFDSTGCVITDAWAYPYQSLTNPGQIAAQSVFVGITQYNICTNNGYGGPVSGVTNINPATGQANFTGTAQFGGNLSGASVNGTVTMYDIATGAQAYTSTVNLTWKGYGPTNTFIDSQHSIGYGFIFNSHFHGTNRQATASGAITDASGANVANGTSAYAGLSNSTSGTVQLSHS